MQIPSTNEKIIIIKPNNEGIGFKFNCYPDYILDSIISKEDFDATVRKAHRIVESTYLIKKHEEDADYIGFIKNIIALVSVLLLVVIILFMVFVYSKDDNNSVQVVSLILLIVTGGLILFAVLKTYLTRPNFINVEEVTKQKLSSFLEAENNTTYKTKGFYWKMGQNYFWLELRSLDRGREANQAQASNRNGGGPTK